MFCPNCGQDCGDARFCSGCGTQLQQAVAQDSKKTAWSVGTPCPYCGGVGLNGNCCAFCGVQLISEDTADQKAKKELKFPEPPIGIYKDAAGYIEIGDHSVTFLRNLWPLAPKSKLTIPFDEIYAVSYAKGVTLNSGFLCVRSWQDRYIPLCDNSTDAVLDKTSVYFRKTKNEEFYRLFVFLKECENINKAEDK